MVVKGGPSNPRYLDERAVDPTNIKKMPILHTNNDVRNEEHAANVIETAWGVELHRYPQMARVDWFISRGQKLVAYAEMKRRNFNHDKYPTVFISISKWAALYEYSRISDCEAIVIYGFDDGIWYEHIKNIDPRITSVRGRKDRGIASDFQPAIEVPVKNMRFVGI